ncbi:hypothetical protein [Pseudodesulfovibrio portus]|jgi:hypothetical protein|uniref:Uncharacterized protein n=1 Tax=Pseudodesulfovibrio portus TaxID=231439 RepID=A0ABN6RWE1_9BACT|nr:hypothetical protein [Pseudodesulfovibrio portus]BDQ34238.1 hypothetical protein JCM14722_17800 [Pseudodesulfovibrio portus]
MPAIESIRIQESPAGEDRIRELKARAAEALDNAMNVVTENLGRAEAVEARESLAEMDTALAAQEAPAHRLDLARVMDLIADPFEDD